MSRVAAPRLLQLPRKVGPGGTLGAIEGERQTPFAIRRVFYVTDLAPGVARGGHAHKAQEQALVALSGAVAVRLDDGRSVAEHRLDRPDRLLYVPPMVWLDYVAETPGAVLLVLASDYYDEADYLRDRAAFEAAARAA